MDYNWGSLNRDTTDEAAIAVDNTLGGFYINALRKNLLNTEPAPEIGDNSRIVMLGMCDYLSHRYKIGLHKYHQPLVTHDGRNSTRDALDEAVDLSLYLMKKLMEESEDGSDTNQHRLQGNTRYHCETCSCDEVPEPDRS